MNIIGPFTLSDWKTMRMVYTSLRSYQHKDPEKFAHAKEVETEIYNDYRKKYQLSKRG
jgi:hypothetical protein